MSATWGTWLFLRVFLPAQPVVNVGPELLHFVGDPIPHDLRAPDGHRVRETPVLCGMVGRGNPGGHCIACDFGIVELTLPEIAARDHEAAEGVTRAAPESSSFQLKITRILV